MSDFQQTVDLREKMESQRRPPTPKSAPPAGRKAMTPLEKIYQTEIESGAEVELKKINKPTVGKSRGGLIKSIIFILAFLIVGFTVYSLVFKNSAVFNKAPKNLNWYAVKLVDGKFYYGQISDLKANPVTIVNVYYDYDQAKDSGQKEQNETGSLRLVKRGKETHGPDGTMAVYQSQILLLEPLKSDSKVLQAILEYEK
ncbi:MAG: hypothetical protein WCV70_04040 [Patescibacteria group bacterium]|jgi:hypothetical protein